MTLFGYLIVLLGIGCGVLVWRATKRLWHSIFAAIAVPMIGVIVFGALLGRETFESTNPFLILVGAIIAIAILAFLYRKK